jgi:hypothetical protein
MSNDHHLAINDGFLATGDSDSSLGEMAVHLPALGQPLPPNTVAAIRARAKQDHGIYFCSNSSNKSYAGYADAQECMPEAEIADFIRYGNQDLFEKLNKMPLESSHLAGDGERRARDASDSVNSKRKNTPSTANVLAASENGMLLPNNEHQVPIDRDVAITDPGNGAQPLDIDCPSEPDTMLQAEDLLLLGKHAVRSYLQQD